MIQCRAPFEHQAHLTGHLKTCSALKQGSYWCPYCRQEETIMLPAALSNGTITGQRWHMLDAAYLFLAKLGSKAGQRVSKLLAFKFAGRRRLMNSKNTPEISELEARIQRPASSERKLPINQEHPRPGLDNNCFAELVGSDCYYSPGQVIKLPFSSPVELSGCEPKFELENPLPISCYSEASNLKHKHASSTEDPYISPLSKGFSESDSSPSYKKFFGDLNFGQSAEEGDASISPTSPNISLDTSPNRDHTRKDDRLFKTTHLTATFSSTAEDALPYCQHSIVDHHQLSVFSAHPGPNGVSNLNKIDSLNMPALLLENISDILQMLFSESNMKICQLQGSMCIASFIEEMPESGVLTQMSLAALRSVFIGILPSTILEVYALLHLAYACALLINPHDLTSLYDEIFADVLGWSYAIDATERAFFDTVVRHLWEPEISCARTEQKLASTGDDTASNGRHRWAINSFPFTNSRLLFQRKNRHTGSSIKKDKTMPSSAGVRETTEFFNERKKGCVIRLCTEYLDSKLSSSCTPICFY